MHSAVGLTCSEYLVEQLPILGGGNEDELCKLKIKSFWNTL